MAPSPELGAVGCSTLKRLRFSTDTGSSCAGHTLRRMLPGYSRTVAPLWTPLRDADHRIQPQTTGIHPVVTDPGVLTCGNTLWECGIDSVVESRRSPGRNGAHGRWANEIVGTNGDRRTRPNVGAALLIQLDKPFRNLVIAN
jgi:hypothetical protein